MSEDPPILLAVDQGVAEITLNRPQRLNAFNAAMHQALAEALKQLRRDPALRALLITGAGRGFCAGQDLADRPAGADAAPPDPGATLEQHYNPLIRTLRDLEVPVVAAVNGVAAGAGANLALACDLVLAARSARFVQSFTGIGLVPDCGGTWILPRLLGPARAAGLALTGAELPAEQAAHWGLIWQVLDDEELLDAARDLARDLASGPTRALALTKRALAASPQHSLDQQLDMERDLQRIAGRTEDYREGVAAGMAKRPPRFRGR